jgi:uncharacterized protein
MVEERMRCLGTIAAIWRYPIKSLAAEPLAQTRVEPDGIPGDRAAALIVQSEHARAGKPYRGKEHNLLHTTSDPGRALEMGQIKGITLSLEAKPGTHYFDDAPISLIFDRWIGEVEKALGMPLDPRRWRPNFLVRAEDDFSFSETDLLGATIETGDVRLHVREPIGRCVATTYDVETGERDDDVLLYVAQNRANRMGVYCEVELAGTVRAGDPLRLRAR